jgi:hypothetical protein
MARGPRRLHHGRLIMDATARALVTAAMDASAYTAGAQQVEQANRRIAGSGDQVAASQEKVVETTDRGARAAERLQRSLDDTFRSQQQYESALRRIATAQEGGYIGAARAAELQQLAAQRYLGAGTAVAAANDNAGNSTRRLGQIMGQAGFQIQDFASQVSAGQSALVALSQQGSQMLGVFGTGGAIAGAILTVGILVYQLMAGRTATDELAEAQKRLETATGAANDLFETQIERVQRLERAARSAVIQTSELAASSLRQQQAGRAERLAQLEPTMDQVRQAQAVAGTDTYLPENIRRRAAEYFRLQEEMRRTAEELERLDRRMENARTGAPTGRQLDEGRSGGTKPGNASGGGRAERPAPETATAVARAYDDASRALDAYNQRQNLTNAGLDRASGLLQAYERDIGVLEAALANQVITEAEFGEAVESATVALGRQINELEQRGRSADQMGRELGMTFSSAFEDAILKGKEFSAVLQSLAQDIARIIVRQTITAPLASAIGGAVNSFAGSLFGTPAPAGGGNPSIPFGGPRAGGGPVQPGRVYEVGELGPELFVPETRGTIMPTGTYGGITFAPSYHVDARGADESMLPRIRAEMVAISRAANAELLDLINRGGAAAKTVGRR